MFALNFFGHHATKDATLTTSALARRLRTVEKENKILYRMILDQQVQMDMIVCHYNLVVLKPTQEN